MEMPCWASSSQCFCALSAPSCSMVMWPLLQIIYCCCGSELAAALVTVSAKLAT